MYLQGKLPSPNMKPMANSVGAKKELVGGELKTDNLPAI
jgi:hypothetical protein